MMRARSIVAVLLALAASAAAQDKPNFAGTWKLADSAQAGGFTPSQIVIAQDATLLTLTSTGQMGEFKTTYKLDGTAGSSPLEFQGNTMDRTTKLAWKDKTLVLTAASDMGGQGFEVKTALSSGPDGTLIVETTFPDFQGGGGPTTTKATYKKNQ